MIRIRNIGTGFRAHVQVEIDGFVIPELRTLRFNADVDSIATLELHTFATNPIDIELFSKETQITIVQRSAEAEKLLEDLYKAFDDPDAKESGRLHDAHHAAREYLQRKWKEDGEGV